MKTITLILIIYVLGMVGCAVGCARSGEFRRFVGETVLEYVSRIVLVALCVALWPLIFALFLAMRIYFCISFGKELD